MDYPSGTHVPGNRRNALLTNVPAVIGQGRQLLGAQCGLAGFTELFLLLLGQKGSGERPPERGNLLLAHGTVVEMQSGRLTFSGIGSYQPRLFAARDDVRFSLAVVLRDAIETGTLSGEHHRGEWIDVGTPERLEALDRRVRNIESG